MKKLILLVLCFLLATSLVACGGEQGADTAVSGVTVVTDENNGEKEQGTNDSAFDTSWASNDFERLFPKPPFDDWHQIESPSSQIYELGRDNSADWEDEAAWEGERDVFYEYVNGLEQYGFTLDEPFGRSCTQVDAYDQAGNRFTFTDYGSEFFMQVIVKEENLSK